MTGAGDLPIGARIVCESGHLITTLKQPLAHGEVVKPEHLEPLECGLTAQTPPNCPVCDAEWVRVYLMAESLKDDEKPVVDFHVEGRGWVV